SAPISNIHSEIVEITRPQHITFCQDYAAKAVSAANDNQIYNCGGTGPRWTTENSAHLGWCLARIPNEGAPNPEPDPPNQPPGTCPALHVTHKKGTEPPPVLQAPTTAGRTLGKRKRGGAKSCADNMFLGQDGKCYPILR